MKETVTTGEIARILGISPTTVRKLISNNQLRGWTLPRSRHSRILLSTVEKYQRNENFPRVPLLRFLEENAASKQDLEHLGITEPIGIGNIRFYPNEYRTLTTGEIANITYTATGTVANIWVDKCLLNFYRLPTSRKDRRVSADDLLRFMTRKQIPIEGQGLERKTTLLINYPGDWNEENMLTDTGSLWYKQTGPKQEISIRDGSDGLYVLTHGDYIYVILTGMTGREEYGQVAHPEHVNQIYKVLNRGIESAATIGELSTSGTIIITLQKAQKCIEENYEVSTEAPKPKSKVLNAV